MKIADVDGLDIKIEFIDLFKYKYVLIYFPFFKYLDFLIISGTYKIKL